MANLTISRDVLAMFITALAFTAVGIITGATFYVILCGSCLALIVIELVATRGHITE